MIDDDKDDKNKEIDEQIADLSAQLFSEEISSYECASSNSDIMATLSEQIAELECQKEE